MAIYDETGRVGQIKAYKQYFQDMQKVEEEGKGAAASRKMGFAASKGLKEFTDFMSPTKLTEGGTSIFKPQVPKGNIFQKVGQKLAGHDLSTAVLTPEAKTAGYELAEGRYNVLGKTKKPTVLTKYDPTKIDAGGKFTGPGEEVSKQFGGAGTKLGSILGAYLMGTGLSTVFDPKSSDTRKVAGGVSAVLGANALLALGGANAWNPVGCGALAVGAGATLADYFG